MTARILAIECPICGSPQKIEVRPGDYRCHSCGAEYYLQGDAVRARSRPPPSSPFRALMMLVLILVAVFLIMVVIVLVAGHHASTSASKPGQIDWGWSVGYDQYLYVESDGTPELITFGWKETGDAQKRNTPDYIAFTNVASGAEVARVPMPGTEILSHRGAGHSPMQIRQLPNHDILVIADESLLFRVKRAEHSIENITDSFFSGRPELASGIAKLDFIDENDEARLVLGEGFNVVSNENLNRFYFPLDNKLYTADAVDQVRKAAVKYTPNGVEKTGFVSSNELHPPFSRLMTYRYLGNFDPIRVSRNYLELGSPERLKAYGVVSLKEFMVVQGYFVEKIECYDDQYVLLYVRSTAAKDPGRFLQAIDARTAQVMYTTPIDARQPLRECVRYKDGFALSEPPDVYTITLAGHLTKHTPVMYSAK